MKIQFTIQGKAFSVNKAYYATRKILTGDAKEWIQQVQHQLEEVKDLVDFAATHAETGHGQIEMHLTFYYPKHQFFNGQGQISSKTYDLDNSLKLLIDVVFRHMDMNDKYITKIVATKAVGSHHYIEISLKCD